MLRIVEVRENSGVVEVHICRDLGEKMRDTAAMTKKVLPVGGKTGPTEDATAFGEQIAEQQSGTKADEAAPGERGDSVMAGGRIPLRLSQPVKMLMVRKFLRHHHENKEEQASVIAIGVGAWPLL